MHTRFVKAGVLAVLLCATATSTDEFEQTRFIGGTLHIVTNVLFFGIDTTTLVYNFDQDFLDILLGQELVASTRLVPLPAGIWFLLSGAMVLVGFRRAGVKQVSRLCKNSIIP